MTGSLAAKKEESEVDEEDAAELLALKRIFSKAGEQEIKLVIPAPEEPKEEKLSLYIISDTFPGCDVFTTLTLHAVDDERGSSEGASD